MICRFGASIDGEMSEATASSAFDRGFMSGVVFDYRARATMLSAGGRQRGHTFCWCSLILWQPLHDDRIAAPVRALEREDGTGNSQFCF